MMLIRILVAFAGIICGIFLLCSVAVAQFDLHPLPPPDQYGNMVIDRNSTSSGIAPVVFPHWFHRQKFTCRVCHYELEFNMKANTTEITEPACRNGKFCGTCHNGTTSFTHADNCQRCHNTNLAQQKTQFEAMKKMPATGFGNRIDWNKALALGLIKPASTINGEYLPIVFDRNLTLEAEWRMISPAVFPHKLHEQWLDCANCHPEIFNIQKKSTSQFSMVHNLNGEFCGVCHLTVAFPFNDCKRCHPQMHNR